jgi:hypothetical protein
MNRLEPLLKSDRSTLVFEAIRDDKVRVNCSSWEVSRTIRPKRLYKSSLWAKPGGDPDRAACAVPEHRPRLGWRTLATGSRRRNGGQCQSVSRGDGLLHVTLRVTGVTGHGRHAVTGSFTPLRGLRRERGTMSIESETKRPTDFLAEQTMVHEDATKRAREHCDHAVAGRLRR